MMNDGLVPMSTAKVAKMRLLRRFQGLEVLDAGIGGKSVSSTRLMVLRVVGRWRILLARRETQ